MGWGTRNEQLELGDQPRDLVEETLRHEVHQDEESLHYDHEEEDLDHEG